MEQNHPFQIEVDKNEQTSELDVKSLKFDDFDGQLKHNCSAHPKVDQRTGEFFAFGYNVKEPKVDYSVFDAKR